MVRAIFAMVGAITALFPDRVLDAVERYAIEQGEKHQRESHVRPAIQVEGVAVAAASILGGKAYSWMMSLTGIFGVLIVFFPDHYLNVAAKFVYEDPEKVTWKKRFIAGLRIIGIFYLLIALKALIDEQQEK